jgi:catechol 2,3-dioxygenase-like lactoylglutathione lyase family enzyme
MLHAPLRTFFVSVALIGACFAQSNQNQSNDKNAPQRPKEQAGAANSSPEPQKGRILGIGGIFFKSEHPGPMREWYAKNLGLSDQGGGATLQWRDKENPQQERTTVWSIFPASSKYFEPSQLMVNYIVDDLDALLDRLSKAGVKIDPKRQDEAYGRFAWIYDPDGNKIELWQPK